MIKRVAVLFLIVFVFSGGWWNKSEPKQAAEPVETEPVPAKRVVETPVEAPAPKTPDPVKQVATQNDGASNTNPTGALKVLSEGDPETRKARLESLVRLSNALRKQRETHQP